MTFYRHFCERNDFLLQVHTFQYKLNGFALPYQPIPICLPRFWQRLKNTRLNKLTETFERLYGSIFLSKASISRAKAFSPDVVFTVGGSFDWTSLAAKRLADIINVPLIASFNDWFDYPWFTGLPKAKKLIESNFTKFYQTSDLALCTSDGMKDALGVHPNAHVWYPSGAEVKDNEVSAESAMLDPALFTVLFGGSLGEWYGPMLESLVLIALQKNHDLRFRIFGSLQTWSRDFDVFAKERGIYLGSVPFEELNKNAEKADLLLLPMGFHPETAHVERTSFKTKFLDYLSFKKPILVWGPEYCSAVRVAREFDSAEIVTDPSPHACIEVINKLSLDCARRKQLSNNAMKMYHDRFHPAKIHQVLLNQMSELISKRPQHVS